MAGIDFETAECTQADPEKHRTTISFSLARTFHLSQRNFVPQLTKQCYERSYCHFAQTPITVDNSIEFFCEINLKQFIGHFAKISYSSDELHPSASFGSVQWYKIVWMIMKKINSKLLEYGLRTSSCCIFHKKK